MPELDITASLTGFRTVRTLPSELRAREKRSLKEGQGNSEQSTPATVRNVRQPASETVSLPVDQVPWLQIARQILAGEFNGADGSTVETLVIGLRGIAHPMCRQALARLHQVKATP